MRLGTGGRQADETCDQQARYQAAPEVPDMTKSWGTKMHEHDFSGLSRREARRGEGSAQRAPAAGMPPTNPRIALRSLAGLPGCKNRARPAGAGRRLA